MLWLFLSKLTRWEMVCRENPVVPMWSVLFSASADVFFPAALMARKVRKMMPGTSERCPRDVFVYWGMMQALQVNSEKKEGIEGWPYSLSDPPVGHSRKGVGFMCTLAPSEI